MRNLNLLNDYRVDNEFIRDLYGSAGDDTCGVFQVVSPADKKALTVIASTGGGWDHVSVSKKGKCPTWAEMEYVKRLFFLNSETAMQLHVPEAEHINIHSWTLHLWRPQKESIPRPPAFMV